VLEIDHVAGIVGIDDFKTQGTTEQLVGSTLANVDYLPINYEWQLVEGSYR
jgi:hypothetical protein